MLVAAHRARQAVSLEQQVKLYGRCVHVVSSIIESGGALNDTVLAKRLGYSSLHACSINFVWRRHPVLGRIIREYRHLMSSGKEHEVKQRMEVTEVKVINAAVRLYTRGEQVSMLTLANELGLSKYKLVSFLSYQDELKEEIGLGECR